MDWIGRRVWLWFSTLRYEGKIDIFQTSDALTGAILRLAGDRIYRKAVNVQCRAPLCRITTVTGRPRYPTWRIELHLHEGCTWMLGTDRRVNDILVGIGCAGTDLLRKRLSVAHCHAEPESRVKLEVERLSVYQRCRWWILVKGKPVLHLVAGAGCGGIEKR